MKIKRWEKNKDNSVKEPGWKHNCPPACKSRHNNWDTSGLKKLLAHHERQLKKPALYPR